MLKVSRERYPVVLAQISKVAENRHETFTHRHALGKCMCTCSVGQPHKSTLSVSVGCHFNQLHNVQLLSSFMYAVVKNLMESVIIVAMEKLQGTKHMVSP